MSNPKHTRDPKKYHTGFDDGLESLEAIDISKINDFDEMAEAMSKTAFGGRLVGEAVDVATNMFSDPDTFVIMTLSGAMTPAKMGLLICEMIDRGFVQAIISTGALMTHGFVEGSGRTHFKYNPHMNDTELYQSGYNRIYDVLEPEKNLDEVEEIIHEVLKGLNPYKLLSSRVITHELGQWLNKTSDRGVLKSAFQANVPVYIPAFTDSELGLDIAIYNMRQVAEGKIPFHYNDFTDLYHYMELINQQKKIGLFTIGGGVPRNWAQQIAPFLELILNRLPRGNVPKHVVGGKKFSYGVRICPEPVTWGGLSGCTYSEGISWGKIEPNSQFAEVLSDATMVWPFILKAVVQRLEKRGITKIEKNFDPKKQVKIAEQRLEWYKLDTSC